MCCTQTYLIALDTHRSKMNVTLAMRYVCLCCFQNDIDILRVLCQPKIDTLTTAPPSLPAFMGAGPGRLDLVQKRLCKTAVMWPGQSIRSCAQQRSPLELLAPALARRACPPSWYLARLLAACTATWLPRRLQSLLPLRLSTCLPRPPWTSAIRSFWLHL